MKCQYPECTAEAKFSLGLADPDAELSYYCEGHAEIRRHEIMIELFGFGRHRCIVIKKDGNQCHNSKKFGDYCGIHAKLKQNMGNKNDILSHPKGWSILN